MDQIGELAASFRTTLGGPLAIFAGTLLLLLGRRLYWLLAGVVGFVVAFVVVPRLLPEVDQDMTLVVALLAGVVGAVVVVFVVLVFAVAVLLLEQRAFAERGAVFGGAAATAAATATAGLFAFVFAVGRFFDRHRFAGLAFALLDR
jgi:uncharacterized membrane protein